MRPVAQRPVSLAAGWQAGPRALLLAMLLSLWSPGLDATEGTRVAYVDMKRLIDNAPQVAASRERLTLAFRARSQALEREQEALAELESGIELETPRLSLAELEARQRELEQRRRSLQRGQQQLREELSEQMALERIRIEQLILDVAIGLAREQGIDLVLPGPVIFASPSVDLTDQVLDRLAREAR